MANSCGTENPVGLPPDGLIAWIKYHLFERSNLNFAVANFDRGAPFLNFVMLQFVEVCIWFQMRGRQHVRLLIPPHSLRARSVVTDRAATLPRLCLAPVWDGV